MARDARPTVTPLIAATVFVALASIAGQGMAATYGSAGFAAFAAAAFAGAIVRVGWQLNRPWWSRDVGPTIGPSVGDAQPAMAATNARLVALGYGWGAASLLSVYLLTTLSWQHGWQYGAGMALIALGILAIAQRLPDGWSTARGQMLQAMTVLHALAASVAIAWLIGSGKIGSTKPDWAANIVFAAGALIILALSAMAVRTSRALDAASR